MTAGKAIRLSKVARELNVGTSTIIEFLSSKGHELSSNPNTKLGPELHEILLQKFQPDMLVKQKKEQALVQAEIDRAELFGKEPTPPKNDSKFLKENVPPAPDEASKVVEEKPKEPAAPKSKEVDAPVKKEEKTEEAVEEAKPTPKEAVIPTSKELEPAKAEKEGSAPKEKKEKQEVKEQPKEEPKPVVKPEPKAEPQIEEKPEVAEKPVSEKKEQPKEEDKPLAEVEASIKEEKPVTKTPEKEEKATSVVEETAKEDSSKAEAAKEDKEEKKSGLKVLGKIELPAKSKPKSKKKSAKKEESKPATAEKSTEKAVEAKKEDKDTSKASESTELPQEPTPKEGEGQETNGSGPVGDGTDHKWEDKREELKGLTVLGKIDVKQFEPKKKKPDANAEDRKKRKRKRITASKAVSSTDDRAKLQKANRDAQDKSPGGNSGNRNQRPGQGNRPGGPPRPGGQQNDRKRTRGRRDEKAPVDDKAIQNQIKETLNRLTNKDAKGAKTKLRKKKKEILRQKAEEKQLEAEMSSNILEVTEFITANELANLMDVTVTKVIMACMNLGMMVSINQRIDAETIALVADEFGFEVKFKQVEMDEPSLEEENEDSRMQERAPIVTIMGHVDHGKTSLLDFIRKANVIAGEAGGITQHIGAYEVKLENGKRMTFLDTPGHEAFTAMRARGAKVTDVVIIVVAADDRVMPQTKEAIAHAQAAGVPMVFAINKVDREASNPDLIKQQLSEENILLEEWGGKYQSEDISAKTGLNVDSLLEKVLLEAEILELKADADKRAVGTVIEATLDKGRGIVSTILVEAGTLRVGDNLLAGAQYGKVKALTNERGKRVKEAGPSTPVQMLGFDGAPSSGDRIYVTKSEQEAKQIASERSQLIREQGIRATKRITLVDIGRRIAVGSFKELKVIVKGDVDGSVEALSDSLLKLSTQEIQVSVIHKAVGQISETDVMLAAASDAVIIGFQVRPSPNARMLAEKEQIDVRLYSIIYDAIDELKSAMEGMLEPKTEEKVVATLEIREVFKITKVGTIAGCMVMSGKMNRNHKVRIIREGVVRHTGDIGALKRFKDDVKEVTKGYECGVQIANYNDIQPQDIIEAFELVEVKRKLGS